MLETGIKEEQAQERTLYPAPGPPIEPQGIQKASVLLVGPFLALLSYCIGLACL